MKLSSILILSVFLFGATYSLDETKYHEVKCNEFNPKVDMKWISTIKTWYVPMWSRLDRIRTASEMFGKPVSELKEEDIKKACPIQIGDIFHGFGKTKKFNMENTDDGIKIESGEHTGLYQYELTDNKSFVLGSICWEDGQVSWGVITTTPTVSPGVEKRIRMHVESLGFNPKMIYKESYEGCDLKGQGEKVEL